MSNNFDNYMQCAITKDNENSTLRNWFNYQYDQVEHLLLFGGVMIGFTLILIMGF